MLHHRNNFRPTICCLATIVAWQPKDLFLCQHSTTDISLSVQLQLYLSRNKNLAKQFLLYSKIGAELGRTLLQNKLERWS